MEFVRFSVLCLVGSLCGVTGAAPYWTSDGGTHVKADFVTLNANDDKTSPSFAGAGNWSPSVVPDGEHDFFVPTKKSFYTKASSTFAGRTLAVEGELYAYGASCTIPVVDFLPGSLLTCNNNSYSFAGGTWTFYSTEASPAKFTVNVTWADNSKQNYSNVKFKGDGASCLRLHTPANGNNNTGFAFVDCDFSEFCGTMRLASDSTKGVMEVASRNLLTPGTVDVESKSTLSVSPGYRLVADTLKVGNGCRLTIKSNTQHEVTNLVLGAGAILSYSELKAPINPVSVMTSLSLPAEGTVMIELVQKGFSTNVVTKIPLLRLPESAGSVDLSKFTWRRDPFAMEIDSLTVEETDSGRILYANLIPMVQLIVGETKRAESCFLEENKAHWSDGLVPTPGKTYFSMSKTPYAPDGDVSFSGKTLVLGGGVQFAGGNRSGAMTIDDWRMFANSSYMDWQNDKTQTFLGHLLTSRYQSDGTDGGFVTFYSRNNTHFNLGMEIGGDGRLRLMVGYTDTVANLANPKGVYTLSGLNTNFTGKIQVTIPSGKVNGTGAAYPSETYCARLFVADERNLGGPVTEFLPDALELKQYSQMNVTNDLVLTEASRGIKFTGVGRVNVAAGKTFALVGKTITYNGQFRKEGEGRLVLGGEARFVDGAADTLPLEGTNVLAVTAGSLMPSSVQCLNGVKCVFSAGTRLLYALDPSETGMAETGPLNLKELDGEPVALASGLTSVPVEFIAGAGCPSFGRVALGTYRTKAIAESVKARLAPVAPKGYLVALSVVENGDATSRIVCEFARKGMMLILR